VATPVTAFTSMARAEFLQGKMDAESRVMPANFDPFVTKLKSSTKVETHTYMSALPRLRELKGISNVTKLIDSTYTVANKKYRIGPVAVRKTDLDDDQIGGYMMAIKGLPSQGEKDIGFEILRHLAAGATKACFDASYFFADSHTVGSGDNLMTADNAGNDAVTHKIIALNLSNTVIKPVIFQDRESLTELMTDAGTPQADKADEYEYWADCRFGLAYGYWWDAIQLTITDTPSITELHGHVRDLINRFRTFTLPKGSDVDDAMYVHENWVPTKENLVLCCNLSLAELLRTLQSTEELTTNVKNIYKDGFSYLPTSALGA